MQVTVCKFGEQGLVKLLNFGNELLQSVQVSFHDLENNNAMLNLCHMHHISMGQHSYIHDIDKHDPHVLFHSMF